MPRDFPALPGFYQVLFLYYESLSTIHAALLAWFIRGAGWFHAQLIPGGAPPGTLDPRTTMAIWQLGNCYMLLGLILSFVFRAIRDTLHDNPEAQERILGAGLTVLAFGDITHIIITWIGLPEDMRFAFGTWNRMTHANITLSLFLFSARLAWFAGIGRQRFYYGKTVAKNLKSA